MSKKADEKRQQREDALMEEMHSINVATPTGTKKLGALVNEFGVKSVIYYHNEIEVFGGGTVGKEDVVFDQGLIFNNGLELRRIEKRFVAMFKKNGAIVEYRRERIPGVLCGRV